MSRQHSCIVVTEQQHRQWRNLAIWVNIHVTTFCGLWVSDSEDDNGYEATANAFHTVCMCMRNHFVGFNDIRVHEKTLYDVLGEESEACIQHASLS